MKKLYLLFSFLFLPQFLIAQPFINTRLSFVGNTHNLPQPGYGTLTFNVEAISVSGSHQINIFENAIQIDTELAGQIQNPADVTFSQHYFPQGPLQYMHTLNYIPGTGSISFRYEKSGLNLFPASISTEWVTIVTITIVYQMINSASTVSWFDGNPNFLVTDINNQQITGIELPVPSELINFPLPVELNSFTAYAKGNVVELKWETKTEVNNFGFEIERLSSEQNSETWKKIGFVRGNGNSNSIKNYSFTDNNPTGGKSFLYRLKQIDNDGKFEYSNYVEVLITPAEYKLFQNYPNPFNPQTNIKFSLPVPAPVALEIYSLTGELLEKLIDEEIDAGLHSINFNAENLSSGIYIYRIQAGNFVQQRKMILMK